jgi:hypothetical protein
LQDVEPDGQTDDQALDDQLVERGDAQLTHAVVEYADDQRANDGPADRARAAGQAGAADHHGCDRIKLSPFFLHWIAPKVILPDDGQFAYIRHSQIARGINLS